VQLNKTILLFTISSLSHTFCIAQTVSITGTVDANYLSSVNSIQVLKFKDFISFQEEELAQSPLSNKGAFSLSFSVSQPTHIALLVDNAKAEMVVEPGKTYDINFFAKEADAVNTLSLSVPVEIEFNNAGPTDLNYLIADFTSRYEAFLEFHRPLITRKSSEIFGKIDTMKMLTSEKYKVHNKPYLNTYIQYTFALLEESLTLKGKEKMLKKYISGKPVLLGNYEYMTFFNQLFSVTASYFMNNPKMTNEINNRQDYDSLVTIFKHSKLLENDTVCETVILKALSEYARYEDYKTSAVLAILDEASIKCKSELNRKTALNLKKKLAVMAIGRPAPKLKFEDMEGKSVSLSDFKGKYLYVSFWATWCSSCTQEMTLIPELKKQYGNKITFINISVDKKREDLINFLLKNPKLGSDKASAGWVFLHCNNFKNAKEEFNLLTVPTYFMIDPLGNVLKSPALNPADIEPFMTEIKRKR